MRYAQEPSSSTSRPFQQVPLNGTLCALARQQRNLQRLVQTCSHAVHTAFDYWHIIV